MTTNDTMTVYKLFRIRKDGSLGPLFIDASARIPLGEWINATYTPRNGYAPRGGWHCGLLPKADHLKQDDGRIWCECLIPAKQYTPEDHAPMFRKQGDMEMVPADGHYTWKRPAHQGGSWVIAGTLMVLRTLTDAEVAMINGQPDGYAERGLDNGPVLADEEDWTDEEIAQMAA
jgi:hypothetical protein